MRCVPEPPIPAPPDPVPEPPAPAPPEPDPTGAPSPRTAVIRVAFTAIGGR